MAVPPATFHVTFRPIIHMMSNPAGSMIRTVGVRVDYGDVTAVHDLNLDIGAGEVYGLIGPNGAGKTSTIKVLATLLEPTYGEVFIAGHETIAQPARARAMLGYMPDLAPVYDEVKVWELLDVFARAYGLTHKRERAERVEQVLVAVSLESKRNAMAGTLSRGMTQRLVLAKTLLHRPKVMLLDEPASGLDPIARIELRDLLRTLAKEGRTVLISSHILTEMAGFCTSVGIMERGRLVVDGPLDELITQLGTTRRIRVELLDHAERFSESARDLFGVESIEATDHTLTLEFAGDDAGKAQLLAALVQKGLPIKAFYEHRRGVEDIMLKVGAKEVS